MNRPAPSPARAPLGPPTASPPRTLVTETLLVLGVSLGASGVNALLSLARKALDERPLSAQTTRMNSSYAEQPWLDLVYQLVQVGLLVVPALLALHLLWREDPRALPRIGLDLSRPGADLLRGAALAASIGIPGLALYLVSRELGVNTTIAAADLQSAWWVVPVLILRAFGNAFLENVVMIAYLVTRWTQAGWNVWVAVVVSALIRGTYHSYQGVGMALGNVVMGLVFGWFYVRTRRVAPLIAAHTLLDVVAFVGYAALADRVDWL